MRETLDYAGEVREVRKIRVRTFRAVKIGGKWMEHDKRKHANKKIDACVEVMHEWITFVLPLNGKGERDVTRFCVILHGERYGAEFLESIPGVKVHHNFHAEGTF